MSLLERWLAREVEG